MVEVTDSELAQAKLRWEAESFMFPARSLQGLEDAKADQLAEVELLGETGLHWESLDADYTISGVMNGVFGTKAFMDARRRGGQ